MTGEGSGPTEKWIEEKGAKYPYAYDKGSKFSREMGVSGIPHAILVNPQGVIVWRGTGYPTPDVVEKALDGALEIPLWEWPAAAKDVRSSLLKGRLKGALDAAEKLAASDPQAGDPILGAVKSVIAGKATMLKSAYDSGDFLAAQELGSQLKKSLKGLPECDQVEEILSEIKQSKEAKAVIKGQLAVRKLKDSKIRKAKDAEQVIAQLERIAEALPDTAAAHEANVFIGKLQAMIEKSGG